MARSDADAKPGPTPDSAHAQPAGEAPGDGEQDPADAAAATGKDDEDDYGYRRSRRAQKQGLSPEAEALPAADKKISAYEAFLEEHWEGWLRPVLLIALVGGGYLTYKEHILPESMAGIALSGVVVAAIIYYTAWPALEMIRDKTRRALFGAVIVLWAFSSGYPTLRKSVPKPILGEITFTEASKSAKVPITGTAGPFDLTVTGKIKSSGSQLATAGYEITATGSEGGSEVVEGSLEYEVHQTRARRGGSTQWSESHDQNTHRLSSDVRGHELNLSVDHVDDSFENGLDVQVNPQSLNPWIFWGVGLLVLLIMMGVEATVGDAKDKTHLVMASLGTLSFAFRFYQKATAVNLVRPAIEALFVAVLVGGVGGTLLGWTVRRISGRDQIRPKPAEKNRRRASEPEGT